MSPLRTVLCLGVFAISVTTAVVTAKERSGTSTHVQAALDAFQAAVRSGKSAAQAAELLYTDDVIIVGEGGEPPSRGRPAAVAEMDAHWSSLGSDGVKRCNLVLSPDSAVSSADTYASFFDLHCDPVSPSSEPIPDIRGIYVWKKTAQGWRVTLEQWGVGKFS